jgi:hypothetical protein
MKRIHHLAIATIALSAASPSVSLAQRVVPLGTPLAAPSAEFAMIGGVRELADGTVLVTDPIDRKLVRSDATLTSFSDVGRTGAGPGEYKQPDGVWPLPADSSLLVDLGNARLMEFSNRMQFGRTYPIVSGADDGPGSMSFMLVGGVDGAGNLYYRGGSPGQDSSTVFRYNRNTKNTEIVARIKGPEVKTVTSGSANNRSQSMRRVPLSPEDGWAVAPNGSIFVVRSGDYHVDVIAPGGGATAGSAVSVPSVPIRDADREEWNAQRARNGGISIGVENNNGQRSVSMQRGRSTRSDFNDLPWPDTKPAFDAAELWVDGQSRVWVRRHQVAGAPWLYDVFDSGGDRLASVQLSANRQIVGMGEEFVYVAGFVVDDLQYM